MQIRPSRPLSVIGAMKDIQDYKIMKAKADMAPTLAERAKIEWDWKKQDRTRDIEMKDEALKSVKLSNVEKERKTIVGFGQELANLVSDAYEKTESQEDFTEFIQLGLIKLKEDPGYADQIEDKDGNDVFDAAEIKREDAEAIYGRAMQKVETLMKPGDIRIVKGFGGKETITQAPFKPTEDKDPKTMIEDWLKKHPNSTDAEKIAFAQSLKAKGIKMTLSDGTEIEIGGPQGSDLSAPTTTALQKSLVGLETQLSDLNAIDTAKFTDALTIPGKIKKLVLRTADKMKIDIGKEGKEYLGKTRVFIENIEQVFNQYRKQITGAQAAMKEIQMLRASILNKEMTPTEFEYSFKSYVSKVKRMMRLTRSLLREGFTNEGGKLGKELESRFYTTGDVGDSEVDARGDEIAASLKDKYDDTEEGQKQLGQTVYKQLISEGYDLGQ